MSNIIEQAPDVEYFPESSETGTGNYIHFKNNTPMTVNFAAWHGVRYYYTLCGPNGGTGTPYQPGNQALRFKIATVEHSNNQLLCETDPVVVLDGSKLVTLNRLSDGTFGLCLTDYDG